MKRHLFAIAFASLGAVTLTGCVGTTERVAGEKVDYTYKQLSPLVAG